MVCSKKIVPISFYYSMEPIQELDSEGFFFLAKRGKKLVLTFLKFSSPKKKWEENMAV